MINIKGLHYPVAEVVLLIAHYLYFYIVNCTSDLSAKTAADVSRIGARSLGVKVLRSGTSGRATVRSPGNRT